jgi:hypothetical protein
MKFLTTFHHGFAWQYYEPALGFTQRASRPGVVRVDLREKWFPPAKT